MRKALFLLILLILCRSSYADFNSGDYFGKGLIIEANGTVQSGGGRVLNFASGTTVTVNNNAYQITASGSSSPSLWVESPGNVGINTTQNVGIGTATPGQTLDVQGTVRATGFNFNGTTAAGYVLTDVSGNHNLTMAPASGGSQTPWTSNIDAATHTLTNVGNVGIGTNLNTASLTIQDATGAGGQDIRITDASQNHLIDIGKIGTTKGSFIGYRSNVQNLFLDSTPEFLFTNNAGNLYTYGVTNVNDTYGQATTYRSGNAVGFFDGTPELELTNQAGTHVTVQAGLNGTADQGQIYLNKNNATKVMLDSGADGYYAGGNFGVGNTSPGRLLDVTGTVRATGFTLSGSGAVTNYVLTATDSAGDSTWSPAGSSSQWATQNTTDVSLAGGNVGIGTTKTTTAALAVMNGNVGIGTWVPAQSLNVMGGNVGIGTWVNNGADILNIYTTNGLNSGVNQNMIGFGNSTIGEIAQFQTTTTAGSDQFYINLTGVTSGTNNWLAYRFNGANNKWFFGDSGTNAYFETYHPMYFSVLNSGTPSTTANPAIFIDTNENIGVGTTIPGGALTVMNGNVGIGTWVPSNSLVVIGTESVQGSYTQTGSTNNQNTFLGTTNFTSSPSAYFKNNVGIGTSNPKNTLAVVGNVGIGTTIGDPFTINTVGTGGLLVAGNVGLGTWSIPPNTNMELGNRNNNLYYYINSGAGTGSNEGVIVEYTMGNGGTSGDGGSLVVSGGIADAGTGDSPGSFVMTGGTDSIHEAGGGGGGQFLGGLSSNSNGGGMLFQGGDTYSSSPYNVGGSFQFIPGYDLGTNISGQIQFYDNDTATNYAWLDLSQMSQASGNIQMTIPPINIPSTSDIAASIALVTSEDKNENIGIGTISTTATLTIKRCTGLPYLQNGVLGTCTLITLAGACSGTFTPC